MLSGDAGRGSEHFSNHLNTEPILEGEMSTISRAWEGATSPEIKFRRKTSFRIYETKTNTKVEYSLGFVFPGEC